MMKFTHYTIIGKDPNMIKGHLNNVVHHAGFERLNAPKEIIVIVYRNPNISQEITTEICKICSSYGARVEFYDELNHGFLNNLYACWNLGYEKSDEGWVFRSGSDEAFNYDSIPKLYDIATRQREKNTKTLFNLNTIEHAIRAMSGNQSRHILGNFGDGFHNFDVNKFEMFVKELNKNVKEELLNVQQSISYWGRPLPCPVSKVKPNHNRTEGSAWMITREDWRTYGPMPAMDFDGITGDCWLHDKLEMAGYTDYLTRDAVSFHFFQGERRPVR